MNAILNRELLVLKKRICICLKSYPPKMTFSIKRRTAIHDIGISTVAFEADVASSIFALILSKYPGRIQSGGLISNSEQTESSKPVVIGLCAWKN